MACKRSEQCEHADICKYAKSNAYDILGGSCYRPKKPQTNDEWRRTCSAEEFAEWISNLAYACMRCGMSNGEAYCHTGYCIQDKEDAEKWIQEEHMNLCKTCGTICPFDDEHEECDAYSPLTNEQWFCQLTTSEKAKVLSNATYSSVLNSDILVLGKEAEQKKWELWLMEKHK